MLKCKLVKKMDRMTLDIDLQVKPGQLVTVFGPSGAGKSTLLNMIAGITEPDLGSISLDERTLYSKGELDQKECNMPIHKRHIGYIRQQCYLFPHMSVKENILYSVAKKDLEAVKKQYTDLLELLAIEHLTEKHIKTLSGGEQQRVALARTLLMNPSLLLLDEPFSALDYQRRMELWKMLEELKVRYKVPMVFVTHDIHEANELSDYIAVLSEGRILQIGTPSLIREAPESIEVVAITTRAEAVG